MKKRRGPYGKHRNRPAEEGYTDQQAGFALGYLYRDIETQLNSFGAKAGGAITVADAARRVGTLLLAKAGGEMVDGAERLHQVRGGPTEGGGEIGAGETALHVYPRATPALKHHVVGPRGIAAIKKAQKKRWDKWHRVKAGKRGGDRAKRRGWLGPELKTVMAMRKAGSTVMEIAEALGRTDKSVASAIKRRGLSIGPTRLGRPRIEAGLNTRGKPKKRVLSPAQLAAMRNNIAIGRQRRIERQKQAATAA